MEKVGKSITYIARANQSLDCFLPMFQKEKLRGWMFDELWYFMKHWKTHMTVSYKKSKTHPYKRTNQKTVQL